MLKEMYRQTKLAWTGRIVARLRIARLGLVIGLATIANTWLLTSARAETISLSCSQQGGPPDLYLSIDTTASTAKSFAGSPDDVAWNPATITDDQVTWTSNGTHHWTLNRATGALTLDAGYPSSPWNCSRSTRVF